MRIFLTDLAAYNEGHLVGKWLDFPMDNMSLTMAISEVLTEGETISGSEDHEEYFITDFECDYYDISEYESLDVLNDLARKMEDLDEDEQTAVKLMLENYLVDGINSAVEHLEDIHNTGQTNMEDVAYNYVEEAGTLENMPQSMRYYFDYEALGSDMELNGTYLEDSEGYLWEYVA